MIAPSPEKSSAPVTLDSRPASALLPGYVRLIKAATYSVLPLFVVALFVGKVWWAVSLLAGLVISVLVGGVLHLLVGRSMQYFVANLRGPANAQSHPGSVLQFAFLLLAKFVVLAGLGWAVVSIHALNLMVVLAGFFVAHVAIIVSATRHLKQR